MSRSSRSDNHAAVLAAVLALTLMLGGLLVSGCSTHSAPAAVDASTNAASARELFERVTREYHLPSAEAQGAARSKLLQQAAAGYEDLLLQYPAASPWAAQALRSLGNIRAEQGRLDDAVKLYQSVAEKYPHEDWEILQAWKSSADLLWDARRQPEAKAIYQRIVTRFDTDSASSIVRTIVRASQSRLAAR